jgi:PAS domain S-box-containing protein
MSSEPSFSDVTILAVDDDADILEMLGSIFKRYGYRMRQAFNGRDALDVLAVDPSIDVILLDLLMPGDLNGMNTLHVIRADPTMRQVPVIIVTALDSTEQQVAGLDAGAIDYIAKPFQPRELIARVNAALRVSRGQRAVRGAEERYRLLVEAARDLVFAVDGVGRYTYVSPSSLAILGYFPEAFTAGQVSLLDLAHSDDRQRIREMFSLALKGVSGDDVQFRVRRRDGEERWLSVSWATMHDAAGRPVGAQAIARDVTLRKRSEAAIYQRSQELAALNLIASRVTQSLDLNTTLADALDALMEVLSIDYGAIYVVEGERAVARAWRGLSDDALDRVRCLALSDAPWLDRFGVYESWPDAPALRSGERSTAPFDVIAGLSSTEALEGLLRAPAWLTAPLRERETLQGAIVLGSRSTGRFGENEVILVRTVADQIGVAITNSRLYEETRRRVDELALLNEVGRALTSTLDLNEVLSVIMEEAVGVLQGEAGSVLLLDELRDELVFASSVGPAADQLPGLRLPSGSGIAGEALRSGYPLLVADAQTDPRFYRNVDAMTGMVTRSLMAAPLRARGRMIGVMEVLNKRGGHFTPNDVRLLDSLAQTAATAIVNAQLFERELHRAHQLAALNEIGQRIASSLEADTLMPEVARLIAVRLGYAFGAVGLVDENGVDLVLHGVARAAHNAQAAVPGGSTRAEDGAGSEIVARASGGTGSGEGSPTEESGDPERTEGEEEGERVAEGPAPRSSRPKGVGSAVEGTAGTSLEIGMRLPLNQGAIGRVVAQGRSLIVNEAQVQPDDAKRLGRGWGAGGSLLVTPITLEGIVIGIILVESHPRQVVSVIDVTTLEAVANQLAAAIANSRLYAQVRRRNRELTAMHAISAAVSQSLELQSVLDAALTLAQPLFEADGSRIALIEGTDLVYRAGYGRLNEELPAPSREPIHDSFEGIAARQGSVEILPDVPASVLAPRTAGRPARWRVPTGSPLGAIAALPLWGHDRVQGVMTLMWREPRPHAEGNRQLLAAIGQQIGVAIDRALLFEDTRRRERELGALNDILRSVTSTLDLEQVLSAAMQGVRDVMGVEIGSLLLVDDVDGSLVFRSRGEEAGAAARGDQRLPPIEAFGGLAPEEGIAGWVVAHRQSLRVNDAQSDPRYAPPLSLPPSERGEPEGGQARAQTDGIQVRSIMAAPLIVKERTIGAIEVINKPDGMSEADERLLNALAASIAVAVDNARLYQELARSAHELERSHAQLVQSEKLAATGRLSLSLAHEINNPLQAIANCLHLSLETGLSEERRHEFLSMAREEVDRLSVLVQRMLEFYRPSPGDQTTSNVNSAIVRVLALAEPKLRRNAVEVVTDLASDLPDVRIAGDLLTQVFLNLVVNAAEAMEAMRGARLVVGSRLDESGGWVEVTFADNGPGIPFDVLPHIFEPFFTTKSAGSGLGLAVSYGIIERHGGVLAVRCRDDGTTFTARLPADVGPAGQRAGTGVPSVVLPHSPAGRPREAGGKHGASSTWTTGSQSDEYAGG